MIYFQTFQNEFTRDSTFTCSSNYTLLNITILISGASLLIDVTYHSILKALLNNLNFVRNTFNDHE